LLRIKTSLSFHPPTPPLSQKKSSKKKSSPSLGAQHPNLEKGEWREKRRKILVIVKIKIMTARL
jgi:hypothetical protein